jgi:hypothetical protein
LSFNLGPLSSVDEVAKLLVPKHYNDFERKVERHLIERNHEATLEFYRAVLRSVSAVVPEAEDIERIYDYDA